eukprot:scaffold19198_cov16-Tisochrysis_lutea.AAC.3
MHTLAHSLHHSAHACPSISAHLQHTDTCLSLNRNYPTSPRMCANAALSLAPVMSYACVPAVALVLWISSHPLPPASVPSCSCCCARPFL